MLSRCWHIFVIALWQLVRNYHWCLLSEEKSDQNLKVGLLRQILIRATHKGRYPIDHSLNVTQMGCLERGMCIARGKGKQGSWNVGLHKSTAIAAKGAKYTMLNSNPSL